MAGPRTRPSAASTLIEGYCNDFIRLAASLAQTLEQASMRGLSLHKSRPSLERVERGMHNLADAIAHMLGSMDAASGLPPRPGSAGPVEAPVPVQPAKAVAATASDAQDSCSIQGNSASMPLTSVFQFLSRMRKTGTLHIKIGDEDLNIEIADGCVESTMTNRSPLTERIGHLLVEHEFVKREDVEEFLLRQRRKKKKLGLLGMELIRARLITHAQLQEGLELQARRRIRRACAAKVATYEFLDGQRSSGGHIRIRLPLQPASK